MIKTSKSIMRWVCLSHIIPPCLNHDVPMVLLWHTNIWLFCSRWMRFNHQPTVWYRWKIQTQPSVSCTNINQFLNDFVFGDSKSTVLICQEWSKVEQPRPWHIPRPSALELWYSKMTQSLLPLKHQQHTCKNVGNHIVLTFSIPPLIHQHSHFFPGLNICVEYEYTTRIKFSR